jgi:hypothetical protein
MDMKASHTPSITTKLSTKTISVFVSKSPSILSTCFTALNSGTAVCAIAGLLFISIVLRSPLRDASAQSGTQSPSTESPKQTDAKPNFVADTGADKYKLVFPLSYLKKIYKDPPKDKKEKKAREEKEYFQWHKQNSEIHSSYRNSFIEQLNKAAAQSYRLIALDSPFLGIVRQGNVQYEYAGFEMYSYSHGQFPKQYFKENFERGYVPLAGQGFSVIDHVFLRGRCIGFTKAEGIGDDPSSTSCEYYDFFLLERAKGVEIPRQYRLAMHVNIWGLWGSGDKLTTQINNYRALGFNPILAISQNEILLQPVTDKTEFLPVGTEVKVVTGFKLNKKVNELARQGYRMALIHDRIAVMYRNRDTTTPVSYIWLNARKKSFEQELARLQESGAIYRMTCPEYKGDSNILIFEQPAADVSKRREYKVLKIQFQETENFADQKVDIDLTPSAKETIKTLNSLVKEGFAVRDLFNADHPYAKFHNALITRILLVRRQ